jgi:hypothetical protein
MSPLAVEGDTATSRSIASSTADTTWETRTAEAVWGWSGKEISNRSPVAVVAVKGRREAMVKLLAQWPAIRPAG